MEVAYVGVSGFGYLDLSNVAVSLLLFFISNVIAYALVKALNVNGEYGRLIAGITLLFLYFLIHQTGGFDISYSAIIGIIEILIGILDIVSQYVSPPQLVNPNGWAYESYLPIYNFTISIRNWNSIMD